jgi:large subunit ribosomal protein L35
MPKMKTHKSSAKRFKVSGSGKIIRSKAYKSHIMTKKTAKRKRNLRKDTTVSSAEVKKVKVLLPYS